MFNTYKYLQYNFLIFEEIKKFLKIIDKYKKIL